MGNYFGAPEYSLLSVTTPHLENLFGQVKKYLKFAQFKKNVNMYRFKIYR